MINYSSVLQMGVQSLLAMAGGWACARWRVLDPEPSVQQLNLFILRVCIPALQVWLLAVKTDMRRDENWRLLGAFLAWSVGLQLLCAARQLAARRRFDAARLAIDSLLLSTNNTGILGPVVLEAALGPRYAPLGMLATVVLYFQQLPSAALLFDMHRKRQKEAALCAREGSVEDGLGIALGDNELAALIPARKDWQQQQEQEQEQQRQQQQQQQEEQQQQQQEQQQEQEQQQQQQQQRLARGNNHVVPTMVADAAAAGEQEWVAGGAVHHRHLRRPAGGSWQRLSLVEVEGGAAGVDGKATRQRLEAPAGGGNPEAGAAAALGRETGALLLMAKNPMVWSTGAALVLSCLGSAAVLEPSSAGHLRALGFIEPLLRWFAGCTAPVTLFCTGLWAEGQEAARGPGRGELIVFVALRATLAPALMVAIARLLGFRGDLGVALVILSILPVAQTAFVICKQYDTGTHVVTAAMVVSLLLMLPQLMGTLALLEWSRVLL